ncbi:MAG: YdeI/OmpD-associated family protein [bacterium]
MTKNTISSGSVHKISTDLKQLLISKPKVLAVWEDITPLARNEWLCWIESAKKAETRERRIRIMTENLVAGKRRPCCWAGCIHR